MSETDKADLVSVFYSNALWYPFDSRLGDKPGGHSMKERRCMDTQVNKRISDQLKDTDADDVLYTHHLNKKK